MNKNNNPLKATRGERIGEGAAIALNAVPAVGGVLAGIANSIIEKRQNQRLEGFLIELAANMESIKDSMNSDFIKSEEFADLAEDIFSKAAEARQQEKLDAFSAIFLNTAIASKPDYDEATEISALVSGWQKRHIIMLKILADPLEADQQMGNVVGRGGGLTTSIDYILKKLLPDWDSDHIARTWQDLYDAKIHNTSGTMAMMTDQGIHQLANRLTSYGQKVANYIQLPRSIGG